MHQFRVALGDLYSARHAIADVLEVGVLDVFASPLNCGRGAFFIREGVHTGTYPPPPPQKKSETFWL